MDLQKIFFLVTFFFTTSFFQFCLGMLIFFNLYETPDLDFEKYLDINPTRFELLYL